LPEIPLPGNGFDELATCWIRVGAGVLPAVKASHEALVPPFDPAQFQVKGPLPLTEDAEPMLHRLVVGALVTSVPFALPQEPLISSWAELDALVPPFEPVHDQVNGPAPETDDAVPAVQRLVVGALATSVLFALPQAPLTAVCVKLAEHDALVPPFEPAQDQLQGPLPLTVEAVPAVQRLVVGALVSD
jgi:hypothetical protein